MIGPANPSRRRAWGWASALAGYMESAIRSGHRIAKELGSPQN